MLVFFESTPSRLDPFYGFASYPTKKLLLKDTLQLSDSDSNIAIQRFRSLIQLDMVKYVLDRMASQQQLEYLLAELNSGPATVETLIAISSNNDSEKQKIFLSIAWMMKLGMIKFFHE